jgi:pimeloyl-ACP methyl ester carboxylesterase
MWLCRPDLVGDACHGDLSATEIRADGSRAVVPHASAPDPEIDCFYVYPTVDLSLWPGNHQSFDDLGPMTDATRAQAARFTEICSAYVPLYRQATLGTYLRGQDRRERFLDVAFSDVADAFLHYMGQYNEGRKVVLIGHSQGGDMIVRLLQRYFDTDPAMRERLLVAIAVGWQVEVPKGRTAGATFVSLPVCTRPEELGCVVAYRSHRAGEQVAPRSGPKPGNETACVDPTRLGGAQPGILSRSYFLLTARSRERLQGVDGIDTPFLMLRSLYSAECSDGVDGYRYLGVSVAPAPGDTRQSPLDLEDWRLGTKMGLHLFDMQLPQGDLIDLVARKARAVAAPPAGR